MKSPHHTEDTEYDVSIVVDINKSKWQSNWAMKEFLSWGTGSHGRILTRALCGPWSLPKVSLGHSVLWVHGLHWSVPRSL